MKPIDRRRFLQSTLLGAAAVSLADQRALLAQTAAREATAVPAAPGIIDSNVNLFDWPFRALKYRSTKALVAKLRKHRIMEAWAGSFEALLSKDMNGVNARLAAECREHGPDFLIPFGSVNLAWPDWEEDVRRCHEVNKMPGLRIYPGYQPFDLDHPGMERLVKMTAERGLILQVVFGMEDPRVHHPIINVGPVTFAPLLRLVDAAPNAKIQLLHVAGTPDNTLSQFMARPNTFLDISRLEGNGAVGRMIGSIEGLPSTRVPIDRIIFGSYAPYFPVETALLKLIESPLDAEQLHAILHGNARRLLPQG
ncbi:MAG: amidohydrolase family protein [Verrucomicrobiales bacterium]|nr:amidohydrolase family protein [Verrucomicrobiales bacterium]